MKFYHWTTQKNWEKIKSEWCLWGVREFEWLNAWRCTYLAVDVNEAKQYGDIVLEVEYNPKENPRYNNYCKWCWQLRVYEPIPIDKIRLLEDFKDDELIYEEWLYD